MHRTNRVKPYEAVFISDLHLHPQKELISARFNQCMEWAANNTESLYILGDFFHVWPGDEAFDAWSLDIVKKLYALSLKGVAIYFMVGNRDFLIDDRFFKESGTHLLTEPTVIKLDEFPILLVHGDSYCTKDRAHQWFRKLTRNTFFKKMFLNIPFTIRKKIVNRVRKKSEMGRYNPKTMSIVPEVMLKEMQQYKVNTVIHGHIHKPGLTEHTIGGAIFKQYVLSDWDDSPKLLCYNNSKGFHFIHIS